MTRRSLFNTGSKSRHFCWWIAAALVERLRLASGCSTDTDCVTSCQQATPSQPCTRSTCDSSYSSCRCGDDTALLVSGGCIAAPPIVVGGCQLGYSAQIFAVVPASPEVQPGDLSESGGHASAALITILRRCMASGLGRDAHEIVSRGVTLSSSRRLAARFLFTGNSSLNLIQANIVFDFCVGIPSLQLGSLSAGSFDSSFGIEANRYAAFNTGTVRVTEISSTDATTTTGTPSGNGVASNGTDTNDDGSPLMWLFIVGCIILSIVFVILLVWYFRLDRSAQTLVESFSLPADETTSSTIPRVTANVSFRVEDLNLPDESDIQALSFVEGDVLEVLMNAGEWLFGRNVKKPQETGYFPESYISWWGRPISADFQVSRSMSVLPETVGLPTDIESTLREVGRQPAAEDTARVEGALPRRPSVRAPPRPPTSETSQVAGAVESRAPTALSIGELQQRFQSRAPTVNNDASTDSMTQSVDPGVSVPNCDLQSSGRASPRLVMEPLPALVENVGPVPKFNLASSTTQSSSTVRQGCDVEDTQQSFKTDPSFGETLPERSQPPEKSPSFSDMLEELTAVAAPTPAEPPPQLLVSSPSFSEMDGALPDDNELPRSPPSNYSFM